MDSATVTAVALDPVTFPMPVPSSIQLPQVNSQAIFPMEQPMNMPLPAVRKVKSWKTSVSVQLAVVHHSLPPIGTLNGGSIIPVLFAIPEPDLCAVREGLYIVGHEEVLPTTGGDLVFFPDFKGVQKFDVRRWGIWAEDRATDEHRGGG